jgi:beta-galactosidase
VAPHPRTVFTGAGVGIVDGAGQVGREVALLAGAMHYWRVERRHWVRCLAAMRDLGLEVVQTYVPWAVHEVGAGRFDWSGDRDLAGFLDAVAEAGLSAIVRPGPHINAELTYFGFPERILRDESMLARSGRDTPVWLPAPPRAFPVPSYAAVGFIDEVRRWFEAVGQVVAPHLAPDGPVVAVQVDNELQQFFRAGAYDHDYHPDALAWWAEGEGGARMPPRAWDEADAERCVAWVRFKEDYAARSLAWMSAALDDAGLGGLARFHNLPPTDPMLSNGPRMAAAIGGPVGMDFYHRASEYHRYRERALYLAGSAAPVPYAPEVGLGGPLWLPPMTHDDQASVIAGLIGAGVRGMCFYMTVDRDRWYGAPIATDGATREPASWLATLCATLREADWTRLRRRAPLALVWSRTEARFAIASAALDPIAPVLIDALGIGPAGAAELARDPAPAAQRRFALAVQRALAVAQIPYDIVDEDCPLDRLGGYRAVIVPTLGRIDAGLWDRLHQLDDTTVVLGPESPRADELGRPLASTALPPRAGLMAAASLADADGLADDLEALVEAELGEHWITDRAREVDCTILEDEDDRPRLLVVGNRATAPVTADVIVPAGLALRDPWTDELQRARGATVQVALAPHQVRLLRVEDHA